MVKYRNLLQHLVQLLTRVTFLFLNMFLSPGYRTIFKRVIIFIEIVESIHNTEVNVSYDLYLGFIVYKPQF